MAPEDTFASVLDNPYFSMEELVVTRTIGFALLQRNYRNLKDIVYFNINSFYSYSERLHNAKRRIIQLD